MWLTGFDAPSLHTMYVDKPMRGHGLMQAIARVNRVFKDKPGGLVVDYLGLADELKQALATYTESGGTGKTAIDQAEAVAVMLEKYEICCGLFHGFDWSRVDRRHAAGPAVAAAGGAGAHPRARRTARPGCCGAVTELSQAFALAVPHDEALRIRDDVGFFQAVRAVLAKSDAGRAARPTRSSTTPSARSSPRPWSPTRSSTSSPPPGLKKPDISILSDEFLAEVRGMPQRNLAVELLRKLLTGEIKTRGKRNVVQARSFAELLEQAVRKYQNRAIETAQVIEELIALAKEMRAGRRPRRGSSASPTTSSPSTTRWRPTTARSRCSASRRCTTIARELVATVRKNVTIDWTIRENVRAQLRVIVKRILRKYGYPPDKQEKATQTVLEQAEVLSEMWAVA